MYAVQIVEQKGTERNKHNEINECTENRHKNRHNAAISSIHLHAIAVALGANILIPECNLWMEEKG